MHPLRSSCYSISNTVVTGYIMWYWSVILPKSDQQKCFSYRLLTLMPSPIISVSPYNASAL